MSFFSRENIFLVTGASSGIGQAIALALNGHGATVLANGRNSQRLEETRALAANPEYMVPVSLDLCHDITGLPKWLSTLASKYGKLTGMALSAGITVNAPLSFYDMGKARQVFDICCHVPLKLGGAFCGKRVNAGPGSSIVYIAAAAAVNPNPGQGMYSAAKGALLAGARCLAKEAARHQIRVNCISPGLIAGAMMDETVRELGQTFMEREENLYPLGIGQPQNVADLAVFLLSSSASWLTGQNIVLSGGR